MSEKLKPCPFCGSDKIEYDRDGVEFVPFVVWCSQCGATIDAEANCRDSDVPPFDRWNTRSPLVHNEAIEKAAGWRDIGSAPKDGRRILISDGNDVWAATWLDNSQTKWPWKGWKTDKGIPIGEHAKNPITHWQPYPSPPVHGERGE